MTLLLQQQQQQKNNMVDIMKIENETPNVNNLEAKIALEVAMQLMAKRSGKMLKNQSLRKETEVMLRLVDELETKQGATLMNFIKTLHIDIENGYTVFTKISEKTFDGGVSWGRITSLHLFSALLAEHLRKTGRESEAEKVALWLGYSIVKVATWIREEGRGWTGFIQSLGGHQEIENNVFTGIFNITLGLGTIAAALLISK